MFSLECSRLEHDTKQHDALAASQSDSLARIADSRAGSGAQVEEVHNAIQSGSAHC